MLFRIILNKQKNKNNFGIVVTFNTFASYLVKTSVLDVGNNKNLKKIET
jgi:hypothetical protein